MIRILHVISDKNIGGAGKLLLNLLKESDMKTFDFTVVVPIGSRLTAKISELSINVIESDLSFFSLLKIIKEQKPCIVHTHAAAIARISAKLCGVKVTVNTRHCANECAARPNFPRRLALRIFDRLFTNHTVATAHYVRQILMDEGISPLKTTVIINGSRPIKELVPAEKTRIRQSYGYTDDDFIAGMIARLEHGKGQEFFIKAAEICQTQNPKIKFLIAGDGAMESELKARAKSLNNLTFLGFVENVSEIMNILDANVNCSYISETSSLSLSEGMSVGAVPIVSDCGGNPFMAKDCGIVFPKNDFVALAEAIIDLSENPEKQKLLSSAAKRCFSSLFTAEKMAKETENLYFKLLHY